jgi:hypothetical protein
LFDRDVVRVFKKYSAVVLGAAVVSLMQLIVFAFGGLVGNARVASFYVSFRIVATLSLALTVAAASLFCGTWTSAVLGEVFQKPSLSKFASKGSGKRFVC